MICKWWPVGKISVQKFRCDTNTSQRRQEKRKGLREHHFRTLVKSRRIQVHATWWTLLTYTLNRILDLTGKQHSHLEMPTFRAHVRRRWRRSRRRLFKPHGAAIMSQFEWNVLQKASPSLTGALWFDVTLFAEEWAVYVRNVPPYPNQIQIYHSWERVIQDLSEGEKRIRIQLEPGWILECIREWACIVIGKPR